MNLNEFPDKSKWNDRLSAIIFYFYVNKSSISLIFMEKRELNGISKPIIFNCHAIELENIQGAKLHVFWLLFVFVVGGLLGNVSKSN